MGVSGLDAGNDPRVDVVVPTQPHRRGSHVGAVDERFSLSANVVESIVGEQVDGTLAVARNGAIRSASAAIEVTSTYAAKRGDHCAGHGGHHRRHRITSGNQGRLCFERSASNPDARPRRECHPLDVDRSRWESARTPRRARNREQLPEPRRRADGIRRHRNNEHPHVRGAQHSSGRRCQRLRLTRLRRKVFVGAEKVGIHSE